MTTINTQALLDAVSELIQERESVVVSGLTARIDKLSAENADLRVQLGEKVQEVAVELASLRAAPAAPAEVLEPKADDNLEDWKDLVLGAVDVTVEKLKADWAELQASVTDTRKEMVALVAQVREANSDRSADLGALATRFDALEGRLGEVAGSERVRALETTVDALQAEWPAFQTSVNAAVVDESAALAERVRQANDGFREQVDSLASRADDLTRRVDFQDESLETLAGSARVANLEEVVGSVSRDLQTLTVAVEGHVERRDDLVKDVGELTDRVNQVNSHFDATLKTVDDLRVRVSDAVGTIDKAPSEVLRLLLERQSEAEDWKRGGAGYRALATVRHGGALWQARVDTKTEPGTGESWVMLADGASGATVSCDEDGNVVFTTHLASGVETTATYKMPHVNFIGPIEDGRAYKKYDSVVQDGNVFWALVDDPGKIGETKGNWLCIGYRGKAGRRGPSLEDVAESIRPQLVRELSAELPGLVAVAVDALTDHE